MSNRKKGKFRELTIDLDEWAIVAHYTAEGATTVSSKKVRLPKDFTHAEIPGLAEEVVEKCRYIPQAKLQEVQMFMEKMLATAG